MKKIHVLIFIIFNIAFFGLNINTNNNVSAEKNAEILNVDCKSALLYDKNSGTVIYSKNSEQKLPIASMTKIASLSLIFDEIEKNKLSLDEEICVSENASSVEGSSAFLDAGSLYKVSDLIMSVIVCSANDSTVALAERVAGNEDNFVKLMNKEAKALGLKNTNFINSTGLPALDHYSSAYDISKFYLKICDNPIYKKYSKIWMTELIHPSGRKTEVVNTNRLIKSYQGCDSGKTGFTNDSGCCLTASATRGEMRLVGVVIGAKDSKTRFNEMANMFNYGFSKFENRIIINKDNPLYNVKIKNSKQKEVFVYPENDFVKFLNKGEDFKYSLDYYITNKKAPFNVNDALGVLYVLDANNIVVFETNLIVRDDVDELTIQDVLNSIYRKF